MISFPVCSCRENSAKLLPASKLVGISVGTNTTDIEQEFLFTGEFIKLIKKLTAAPEIELIDISKGSLKSLLRIDFKSWTELLEKIIFILPETRKKNAEAFKIKAEAAMILAQAGKLQAETHKLFTDADMQQRDAFTSLLEKYKRLGFKIQLDKELTIALNEKGEINLYKPDR